MKYLILLIVFLTGCSTFGGSKQHSQNIVNNQNDTGINPYSINEYPTPQQNITRCIEGQIDELISGNEATTIWYVTNSQVGLQSVRLPHTFPIKIKIVNNAFCYDYFDVTFKQKRFDSS